MYSIKGKLFPLLKRIHVLLFLIMCKYVHMSAVTTESLAPELVLQLVVSHLTWVLGTELLSSGGAVCAFSC